MWVFKLYSKQQTLNVHAAITNLGQVYLGVLMTTLALIVNLGSCDLVLSIECMLKRSRNALQNVHDNRQNLSMVAGTLLS